MKNFIFGFAAGLATYHYVSGGFQNEELVSEMRSVIKKLDDRLAATKPDMTQPTQPTEGEPV